MPYTRDYERIGYREGQRAAKRLQVRSAVKTFDPVVIRDDVGYGLTAEFKLTMFHGDAMFVMYLYEGKDMITYIGNPNISDLQSSMLKLTKTASTLIRRTPEELAKIDFAILAENLINTIEVGRGILANSGR